MKPPVNLVSRIIAYEEGDLDHDEVVELFGELVADGTIWHLQGSYRRALSALVESGDLVIATCGDDINGEI